jgi:hypothetical protein
MYAWSRSTFLPQLTPEVMAAMAQARLQLPVEASTVEVMYVRAMFQQ